MKVNILLNEPINRPTDCFNQSNLPLQSNDFVVGSCVVDAAAATCCDCVVDAAATGGATGVVDGGAGTVDGAAAGAVSCEDVVGAGDTTCVSGTGVAKD